MKSILFSAVAFLLFVSAFANSVDLNRLQIQIPKTMTAAEQRAATELKNHLEKISKRQFKMLRADSDIPVIRLSTDNKLPPDGYQIKFIDGNLNIIGGSNFGIMYGVYAFLEEDLKCRWYEPEITVIPSPENLIFPVKERSSSPAFTAIRDPFSSMSRDVDWALRNRCIKAMGRNIPQDLGHCVSYPIRKEFWMAHTVGLFCPPKLFKNHPEYFMLDVNGKRITKQICPSNPAVQKLALDKVLAVLKANPQNNIINLSLNDNHRYCHCSKCAQISKREGSTGAPFFELVNFVANQVAPKFPKVKISFLAYYATITPPKHLKMASNTVVFLAFLEGRSVIRPVSEQKLFPEQLSGWQRAAREIHIWDYQVDFANFTQYELSLNSVAENLRYYRKFDKITGVMLQGSFKGPGGERQGLRAWVEAKLLWDPSLDLWELSKDYIRGVYGIAAPEIEPFYKLLNDLEKQHQPYSSHQKQILATGKLAFQRAKKIAANDPILLKHLELAELPIVIGQIDAIVAKRYQDSKDMDIKLAKRLLAQAEKVAAREKISHLSEGKLFSRYLSACRKKLQTNKLHYADQLSPESWIIPAVAGQLYGTKVYLDPKCRGTKVVRQKPLNTWAWQVKMNKLNLPEGKYRLRLRCWANKTGNTQKNFRYGIYKAASNRNISRRIPAEELFHKDYRWHNLGTFKLTPDCALWTMIPIKDNFFEIFIEALEITPINPEKH